MNPIHLKKANDCIVESRTYDLDGYKPYGAADYYAMDCYVDDFFAGNVPAKILANGGAWDPEKKILWMPGKANYAMFVEVR